MTAVMTILGGLGVLIVGAVGGLMLHEPIMRREAAMRGRVRVVQERDRHRRSRLTAEPPRDDTAA